MFIRVVVLLIVLYTQVSFSSQCQSARMSTCTLAKVKSSGYNIMTSLLNLKPTCVVEFEDTSTAKELFRVRLSSCPKLNEPAYIFVKYLCAQSHDKLIIMSEEQCSPILQQRQKILSKLQSIPVGTTMDQMEKYDIKFQFRHTDNLWFYMAEPRFEVMIKVNGEMCGERICSSPEQQKFDSIYEFRDVNLGVLNETELYWPRR